MDNIKSRLFGLCTSLEYFPIKRLNVEYTSPSQNLISRLSMLKKYIKR